MRTYIIPIVILAITSLNSCSFVSVIMPHEQIAGVDIVSVEDVKNKDGIVQRMVDGVVVKPFETDEEWNLAFQAIYTQKKVSGMDTIIRIYLEEESWELGPPLAIGKYRIDKRAAIKVDDRLIKVAKP